MSKQEQEEEALKLAEDRDAHFMGSVETLQEELAKHLAKYDPNGCIISEITRDTIARWAYQFACHVVNFTSEHNLKRVHVGLWSAEQCVDQIPDMPKLSGLQEEKQ